MLKLTIDYSYEFEIFGIISSIKEYKLAYFLNNTLFWDLFRADDIVFSSAQNILQFSNYEFSSEYSRVNLLRNKSHVLEKSSSRSYLLPELKDYDYILKLESEGDTLKVDFVFDKIKEIPNIALLTRINLNKLKNKENLIF